MHRINLYALAAFTAHRGIDCGWYFSGMKDDSMRDEPISSSFIYISFINSSIAHPAISATSSDPNKKVRVVTGLQYYLDYMEY